MEEKLDIIEILKDTTDFDNNEGFCILKEHRIITLNNIFKEHSNINYFPEKSSINIFSDFIVDKYHKFLSENVFESFFIDPLTLIFWSIFKEINNQSDYILITTNDTFKKLLIENQLPPETLGFNKDNLLKINDEKTFYDTLDFLPDYAVVTDLLGNIHFISENVVESMSFKNKEELIGKSIINFVQKQERKRAIKLLAEYIITKTVDLENHIMVESKDGRLIQLEVNIKPFINKKGDILLLHTLRDVTQRIELEQRLIESEKSFKNSVLNSPLGIHFYYLDENDDLIFNGYNEAAERILNFDHKQLLNKKIEDAFPGLRKNEVIEIYKNVAKSGGKHFFEQIDYQDKSIKGAFEVRAYQTFENHLAVIFFDISERKRNEEEIKRLESEYRNIFDNAPYAIFQTTPEGKFVRMNKEGAYLLGYNSPEEIIQNVKSIRDEIYYNPSDRDKVIKALKNSEGYVKLDIQFKKKTGEPFDTEMLARTVKNESGEVVFLEGFIKDITKRKKAEAELKKIFTEQQTIFDSIPAIICYKDFNNKYLRVNKATAKLLHTKVSNIIGKSADDFFPKHLAEKFHKEDLKVIKSGKPLTGAIDKFTDKDGKDIWLKTDRIPYLDGNGNITGVISISFDITQQYEAEEKVRKYLDYLEFLNKTALDLLKIKNIDEIYDYIIQGLKVLIPDCFAVVLAYNEETKTATVKAINENLINIIMLISEDPKILNNAYVWNISDRYIDLYKQAKLIQMQDSFEEILKYNISIETAKKVREKINIGEIYVVGISKDENLYGMVYIYPQKQITFDFSKHIEAFMYQCALAIDQKIAEQKLIQLNAELEDRVKERTKMLQNTLDDLSAEINVRKVIEKELINAKLELTKALEKEKELNEMKSRFIDMISHEYRTPLTVILSSIYLIESYYESGDFNKVKKHTEKVKKSVDIMTNLIENVLTIGRGDSDKITIEKRWFDLDRILKEIIEEVIIVDKEQHPINLKFKSEINQIYSDSRILRQILTNLILNAVKYSETKKPVDIEVNNDLERVEITITDYGSGIPEEEISKIYEAFFRGKNQIGLTSGTGLGLTIVKRFIDMLEGDIFVESQLNIGTTFKIVIPSK